jgi:hypothetical protein
MFLGVQLLLDRVAEQDCMLASVISARLHAEDRLFLRVVSVHNGNWDTYI